MGAIDTRPAALPCPACGPLDAIDVDRDLANRISGDKQSRRCWLSGRPAKLRDRCLRLQPNAIPGKAGIRVDSLGRRAAPRGLRLPVGIVESRDGPLGIVAFAKTPCAVEGFDITDAGRERIGGGRGLSGGILRGGVLRCGSLGEERRGERREERKDACTDKREPAEEQPRRIR